MVSRPSQLCSGCVTDPRDSISVERVIAATPEEIFAVIADPARHRDFDGSGSVQAVAGDTPERLELGARFGMSMKRGVSYSMLNTVTEFEENRRIAWSPKPASGRGGRWVGRIWRYELEPVEGGTKVTETWDISEEGLRFVLRYVAAGHTRDAMEKSLEKLDALVTAG
jgi:uncharacterized protein YndB with AHSA1/START domain